MSCKYFQNPKDLQNTSLTQWVNPTHYLVKDCKCNIIDIIATSYNFESSFSKPQQHSFCNPKTWIRHEWLVCKNESNKINNICHAFAFRHQHVHPQTGLNLNAPLTDVLVEFPHVFASVKVASIRVNILKKRIWKLTYRRYFMKPNEMYIFPSSTIMVQWTTNQLGDKPLIFQRAYTSTEPSLMLTAPFCKWFGSGLNRCLNTELHRERLQSTKALFHGRVSILSILDKEMLTAPPIAFQSRILNDMLSKRLRGKMYI